MGRTSIQCTTPDCFGMVSMPSDKPTGKDGYYIKCNIKLPWRMFIVSIPITTAICHHVDITYYVISKTAGKSGYSNIM